MVADTDNILSVAQGEFVLERLPKRPRELLRAFDAADEYMLNYLSTALPLTTSARLLILNDSFGALAVALHHFQPSAISDSFLSQQATKLNLATNAIAEDSVRLISSVTPLSGEFDWILIKAPKTLALLEDQLIKLRRCLTTNTQIIVAGMIKNLPASLWKMLERLVGQTTTSLAQKKARLIFVKPELTLAIPENPYPIYYQLENTVYRIVNHANVFSRDSLDIGTRFFLQHLPSGDEYWELIDLGCGNGVVGLIAAERNPNATLHFVDESFMAVASAQENFRNAFGNSKSATFQVGDGLTDFTSASADKVLCNPPFHHQHTIGDHLALSMFKDARRVLRKGGELWVIGNRHLNYHISLKRLFGNCALITENSKFAIWMAKN